MKALSIRQPWAFLVVTGRKTIEIRSWRPRRMKLPQTILVHAGKKFDREMAEVFGITEGLLPKGALLGEVIMTDIVKYETRDRWREDMDEHMNRPDQYLDGLYGFVFRGHALYTHPIPFKGRLNFFEISPLFKQEI